MSMNTVPERLAALRAAMQANGVDVYLIPVGDPHSSEYLPDHYTSLTYFSGFHGENSNFVVTMTESAVWADGRYFVQAEKEIAGTEIQLMKMGEPGVYTFVLRGQKDLLPVEFSGWLAASRHDGIAHATTAHRTFKRLEKTAEGGIRFSAEQLAAGGRYSVYAVDQTGRMRVAEVRLPVPPEPVLQSTAQAAGAAAPAEPSAF